MAKKKTTLKDEISNPSSGFMVPIAILLGGFLIIWGITKMLDGGTTGYKRLVQDLQSKTFGNRWVAAYDLSKYIAGNQVPKEDIAWLIQELDDVYQSTNDERTRNFVVLAMGALKDDRSIVFLNKYLESTDKNVKYSTIVGLSNLNSNNSINYTYLDNYLSSKDDPLIQATLLMLSKHKIVNLEDKFRQLSNSANPITKFNATTALLSIGKLSNLNNLNTLFNTEVVGLDVVQQKSLQLNILKAMSTKNPKINIVEFLQNLIKKTTNAEVKTKAKQALLSLN